MDQPSPVPAREATRVRHTASRAVKEPARVLETLRSSTPLGVNHIAIIPDGNRRWAAERGLPVWDGVRTGVQTAEAIFEAIRRRRIPWCTFWASSYDNLVKRPTAERGVLNTLFAEWFTRLAENATVHRERVRVRVLGEWRGLLARPAVEAIESVLAATASYQGPALTFLIGYDGDREIVATINALMVEKRETRDEKRVTLDDLHAHAWTKELPEVDLLVRTGSWADPHRSANFLPLLTSNVQEAYPEVYWPDFSEGVLDATIADFGERERRLGS